jgi:hypothetical protein
MITNEHLSDLEQAFDEKVLDEIFSQFVLCGSTPSEKVFGALARIYGRTIGELENEFETARVLG